MSCEYGGSALVSSVSSGFAGGAASRSASNLMGGGLNTPNGRAWYGALVDVGDNPVVIVGFAGGEGACECGVKVAPTEYEGALYKEKNDGGTSGDSACTQSDIFLPAGRRRISGLNCLDEEYPGAIGGPDSSGTWPPALGIIRGRPSDGGSIGDCGWDENREQFIAGSTPHGCCC